MSHGRHSSREMIEGFWSVWLSESEMDYPTGERWIGVSLFEFEGGKVTHEIDWFAQPFPAPEWRKPW